MEAEKRDPGNEVGKVFDLTLQRTQIEKGKPIKPLVGRANTL